MAEKEPHVGFNIDVGLGNQDSSAYTKNFKMSFDTFQAEHYASKVS